MARESVLKYGEIQLVSSGEDLKTLRGHLEKVLKKHGYPGEELGEVDINEMAEEIEEDEENELDEQEGEEGADESTDESTAGRSIDVAKIRAKLAEQRDGETGD